MTKNRDDMPHWIFWLVGAAIIIIAILANLIGGSTWELISEIALNIGITVVAVSIIDWIWRRVGGDPLMNAIDELRSATTLLGDLRDTGLRRVFISRADAIERMNHFKVRIAQANQVDMMGIALGSRWINDPSFQEVIEKRSASGKTQFRIMVLDPEAQATAQRAFEEDKIESQRIAAIAGKTLGILSEIKKRLPKDKRDALQIKAIDQTNIYCSVIRADDQMLITKYIMHLTGSNSETLEVEGADSSLFKLYSAEFDQMWKRAADWPG